MEEQLKIYLEDNSWRGKAACKGADYEEFRSRNVHGTGQRVESLEVYKARKDNTIGTYCTRCEVKVQCLEYALQTYQVGILGGTDEQDREIIRKARLEDKQ